MLSDKVTTWPPTCTFGTYTFRYSLSPQVRSSSTHMALENVVDVDHSRSHQPAPVRTGSDRSGATTDDRR